MNGFTAPVARRCSAMCTSLKVALPEPAMRMRRTMTRPGSSSTARAGDQHDLPRLGLRNAERRAHAGADRTDRERGRRHVDAVRHGNGVARGHAGEFGIASPALLAQHAAVAAKVLPPVETISA